MENVCLHCFICSPISLDICLHHVSTSPSCFHHVSIMSPITSPSCLHHSCLNHVSIMSPSCLHHVSIMSPSHLYHVSIMSPSCLHHVSIMSPSCLHHSRLHHVSITSPSRLHHVSITHVSIMYPSTVFISFQQSFEADILTATSSFISQLLSRGMQSADTTNSFVQSLSYQLKATARQAVMTYLV